MNTQRKKLLNTVLFFIGKRTEPTTKKALAKLLFFFDSEHTRQTGLPAIGLQYRAYEHGPLPVEFWKEIRDGKLPQDLYFYLSVVQDSTGASTEKDTFKFEAKVKPDMSVFSPLQVEILNNLMEKHSDSTADQLEAISHQEGTPWYITYHTRGFSKTISYELFLDPNSRVARDLACDKLESYFDALEMCHNKPTN